MKRTATWLALALSLGMAPVAARHAAKLEITTKPGTLRDVYRPTLTVNGLPLMTLEIQIWTGIEWVPIGSDDATRALLDKPPIKGRRE